MASRVASGKSRIKLLNPGVESADDALQLGKFLYQFRSQIGFGQARRLVNHARTHCHSILANDFAHPAGYSLHSQHLVVVAAQVFLEGDVLQPQRALP